MFKRHLYLLYSVMIVLYICNVFLDIFVLHYIIGLLAILSLVFSFQQANILFKVLGSGFLITGFIFYSMTNSAWWMFPIYMTSNLHLIAMLLVLPFMNSIVQVGHYSSYMSRLLKANVHDFGSLYRRTIFSSYVLAIFVNISTFPLVHSFLSKPLKGQPKLLQDRFVTRTILRGVVLALVMSPMEIAVAITVDITGVHYLTLLPWMLLFVIIVMFFEMISSRKYRELPLVEPSKHRSERESVNGYMLAQIGVLLVALSCFLFCIIQVSRILDISFMLAVVLVIIPFSLIWSVLIRRTKTFIKFGFRNWKRNANSKVQNFIVLFIPLALFISALSETVYLDYLRVPFVYFLDYPFVILIMIQLTFLVMSLIGIHAVAIIGIFGEILPPLLDVINPVSLGIVLISGALSTATVAPFGMMLNIVAQLTNNSPFKITGRNIWFAIMFGGIGTLIAILLL